MRIVDALGVIDKVLAPETAPQLLSTLGTVQWRRLQSSPNPSKAQLLGSDPRATLLQAFSLATDLTFHSANPLGEPPALTQHDSPESFRSMLQTFHERHYSVRFPGLRPFSQSLDGLCRALETIMHKPVTASAFWSIGGMQAPVHSDDHDLLVIQLLGRKTWLVSNQEPSLANTWEQIPSDPPKLVNPTRFDVEVGDVVYLPRGTDHCVEGNEESIHLSIGFTPLTLREAMIAVIDHLSDMDRGWRLTVAPFLAHHLVTGKWDNLPDTLSHAHQALGETLKAPDFIAAALQRRSSRAVSQLSPLITSSTTEVGLESTLAHKPNCTWHLCANNEKIDVAYPGGHLYIHRGAEAAVVYMVNTPRFKFSDIPGEMEVDVKRALAQRFVDEGLLEVV